MTVSPVVRTTHDPQDVNWLPLERFVAVAVSHGIHIDADDFMWMGRCTLASDAIVHLYKHVDTRRYLNLDAAGHTYRYLPTEDPTAYETIPSPVVAVREVLYNSEDRASLNVARWPTPTSTTPSPSSGLSL
jgi:hypothetical protein